MAIPIPTSEPSKLYLGATATWKKSLSDYPASAGWQVNYYIRGQSGQAINILWGTHVSASGDDFLVDVPPASMTGATPGDEYTLYGEVTDGSDKIVFYEGGLELLQDPSATFDSRTHSQKMLDLIEATLEGTATREEQQVSISFGGVSRALQFFSRDELLRLRKSYQRERQAELAEEAARAGRATGRIFKSNWSRP